MVEKGVAPAAIMVIIFANVPQNWRAALDSNLLFMLMAGDYIATGGQREAAIGLLASFVESIVEKYGYERVDIVAYSIGSLVTLDALFPRLVRLPSLGSVHTLVTIGCPADFVHTYWPEYFSGRRAIPDVPRHWLNIFEPTDILASNFIIGDNQAESISDAIMPARTHSKRKAKLQEYGVRVEGSENVRRPQSNLRYSTQLERGHAAFLLTASRKHRVYWDTTEVMSVSAFDCAVAQLFEKKDGK
jgi:pimeloyl-ACP methyl ester carboxylesterase